MKRDLKIWELTQLPRYIILVGPRGIGKKYLAEQLCEHFNVRPVFMGIKVDDIRTMIHGASALSEPTMYIIPNSDDMSLASKNAILKTTEEPNNNLYICMTLDSKENTLSTLLSRAFTYNVEPWTKDELEELFNETFSQDSMEIATNPLEVNKLMPCYDELMKFCDTVINKIDCVTVSNSLNMPKALALKDGNEGFEPILFFRALKGRLVEFMQQAGSKQEVLEYYIIMQEAQRAIGYLSNRFYNKKYNVDMFILNVRRRLKEVQEDGPSTT